MRTVSWSCQLTASPAATQNLFAESFSAGPLTIAACPRCPDDVTTFREPNDEYRRHLAEYRHDASQRGQHDELTSLIIHALKQLNGGARMTMKASPLGSATSEMNGKRRPELVDQVS